MSIAEVISRTVGPTSSKRRALEREAARIAGELADVRDLAQRVRLVGNQASTRISLLDSATANPLVSL